MPRPPNFDEFTDIKFITNYALHGCVPPYELVIELSQAPAKDMAVILVAFDPEQWFQELFDPGKGRGRTPSRKGRKRLTRGGFPDWNEWGGSRLRRAAGPFPGLALPGFKYLFRLWGVVDAVQFSAFVVEGLSQIGFETLWGILQLEEDHCKQFDRIARARETPQGFGGAGPPVWPLNLPNTLYNNGFISQTPFGWQTPNKRCLNALTARIVATGLGQLRGALVLYEAGGNILAESSRVELDVGGVTERTVTYESEGVQQISFGWKTENSTGTAYDMAAMGFSTDGPIWG